MTEAELKDKLDKLILKSLHLFEEILEAKKNLEVSLREGFFLISKARYSMGTKSVGILQLPTEDGRDFKALVNVDDRETIEEDGPLAIEYRDFFVVDGRCDDGGCEGSDGTGSNGLRRRLVKDNTEKESEDVLTFDKKMDPLKWFGVLVPQALRTSQRVFHENIGLVCRIASLQSHLESVRMEYKKIGQELNQKQMK